MEPKATSFSRLATPWAVLALLAAVAAAVLVAASGPLYRHQAIELDAAFDLVRKGAWIGLAGACAGALALALSAFVRRTPAAVVSLAALAVGGVAFGWPYALYRESRAIVPIHDVATDPSHPPQFVALAPIRKASPDGVAYGGGGTRVAQAEEAEIAAFLTSPAGRSNPHAQSVATDCRQWGPPCLAAAQRAYYPGIEPLPAPEVDPDHAFATALAAARDSGWHIVAVDPSDHHFEATATTSWFGLKEDVAVDVSQSAGGSVVNARSESRLGIADFGENAQRIRSYLGRVARRLEHPGRSAA